MVVKVHSEEEVARILPIAAKHQVPITFRAAGTSLSGQAITDSVLLKLSHTGRNFRNFHIPVQSASDSEVMPLLMSHLINGFYQQRHHQAYLQAYILCIEGKPLHYWIEKGSSL